MHDDVIATLIMLAGMCFVDRVLYSSVVYPHNYGALCLQSWTACFHCRSHHATAARTTILVVRAE